MSKRFASTCFIVLASILILCFVFVLFLFLLPGVRLLGIKYIGRNTRVASMEKSILSEVKDSEGKAVGTFSGIIVNSYEIPVEVVLSEDYTYYVSYLDNFTGITNSKIKNPSIAFSKDDLGNIVIDVSDFHTFLYQSSISKRYLKLYIPISEVSKGQDVYTLNLTINSKKSPVSFYCGSEGYFATCTFNRISVTTDSKLSVSYPIKSLDFVYKTSNSIEITGNEETEIIANNYDLTSEDGKIIVSTPVTGNLKCTTKLGKVKVVSCADLTVSTSFGDIGYALDDGGKVEVRGVANIETRAGNITLGDVRGGSRTNSIKSSSGNITINTILDGEISSQRGQVNIKSVRNFKVTTSTGKITIEEITYAIEANSTRGKINLGGEGMVVNNPTVNSTLGAVTVISSSGDVNIECLHSNVNFENKDSKNISISCGGKLSAIGLMGEVKIDAKDKIERLEFESVDQGNTDITLGEKCQEAYIYIKAHQIDEICYYVEAKSTTIQKFENEDWTKDGATYPDNYTTSNTSPWHFTLKGPNANIYLRFTLS